MLRKTENAVMANAVTVKKPTLASLAKEVQRLSERLEDIIELRAAVERNAGKPGASWEEVKKELDHD